MHPRRRARAIRPPSTAHWTTANFVEVITQHIYEGLYTLDQSYQPIPDLAEGMPQVSADGLVYTIKLRQGIKFHNGKEMTSEDVVASLKRWGGYAVQAKALWASVEDVRPAGKYAIELRLKEKSGVVLISLANANNFGAIYPKEIAEKYPTPNKVTEFIGTGPYKFVEWKPDSHIRMVRFDDYKPRAEAPNGWGGRKIAYVDEIRWIPTPDVATRVASLESGEVDFADDLQPDAFDRIKANPKLKPLVVRPFSWAIGVFNKKEGLMTNQKLRQAIQAAIDMEPVMKGGRREPALLPAGPRAVLPGAEGLALDGRRAELQPAQQGEGAEQLLQEAGYKGEPDPVPHHQGIRLDVQLRPRHQAAAGGAGRDRRPPGGRLGDARPAPEQPADVRHLHHGHVLRPRPDPAPVPPLRLAGLDLRRGDPEAHGRDPEGAGPAKRKAQWDEVQKRFYEYVPAIRYGDIFGFRAMQTSVKGFNENMSFSRFYNVWLDK